VNRSEAESSATTLQAAREIVLDKRQTVIALAVTFVLVMLAMLIYSESASDRPLIAFCHTPTDRDCPSPS
jgi:hypothetical protein